MDSGCLVQPPFSHPLAGAEPDAPAHSWRECASGSAITWMATVKQKMLALAQHDKILIHEVVRARRTGWARASSGDGRGGSGA